MALIGIWPCALHTADKGAGCIFNCSVYTTVLPLLIWLYRKCFQEGSGIDSWVNRRRVGA